MEHDRQDNENLGHAAEDARIRCVRRHPVLRILPTAVASASGVRPMSDSKPTTC
jgi:hypothetical protein